MKRAYTTLIFLRAKGFYEELKYMKKTGYACILYPPKHYAFSAVGVPGFTSRNILAYILLFFGL